MVWGRGHTDPPNESQPHWVEGGGYRTTICSNWHGVGTVEKWGGAWALDPGLSNFLPRLFSGFLRWVPFVKASTVSTGHGERKV